jgi:hypothetical protein
MYNRQPYTGWDALAQIATTAIQKHAQDKQNRAGYAMYDLATQDPQTFADTRLKVPDLATGGLFGGGGKPIQGGGLLSGLPQGNPDQFKIGVSQPEQEQMPSFQMPESLRNTTDAPAPITRQSIEGKYKPQRAAAMRQAIAAGLNPSDAYKQVTGLINQRVDDEWNTHVTERNGKNIDTLTDKLNNAKDLKSATSIAMGLEKLGVKVHPELIKAAWADPEYDIKAHGAKLVAVNKKNPSDKIDLETGMEMTDYQKANIATKQDANTIRASNRGGGGAGSNSRYIETPLGPMTTEQAIAAYTKAKGGTIEEDDGFGNVRTKVIPANQEVLNILEPIIKKAGGAMQAPQQDQVNNEDAIWYGNQHRKLIDEGMTPEQATEYMTYWIKSNGG